MGVGFFLPTIRRRGKVGRMECIRDYPLFPSYLFLRGSDYDVYCAKQTNRIVNVLHVTKQDQLQQELMDIAKAVASGTDLHRVPLTAGTAVRVASGPLMGVCGIVVGGQSHNRVLLTCSMLGSAVSVSVEGEILETVLQ
jgi:transcription antitermination factor NusG